MQPYAPVQFSGLQQCYTPVYGHAPSQTRPARPQLRQQQSMPVLPFRYQHADSYDSLDAHISKLSMDAGINTLTGYCDVDSMLAAAHGNTCTTQTERFQAFASQHTSPSRSPRSMKTYPLTPPPLIREPAFPEVKESPVFSDDFSGSPTRTNRGRHRGRSTHSDIERRYRHNLVSQFQNLANTVPNIPTQQPARAGQTPKPSTWRGNLGNYEVQLDAS
ncbi:hypothetical protein E4T48_02080 [Aureobasidium sp. EXF-10727]|nr:hypothetical protein E4T48_02080 [Aureobasidium sp. EXF-10727]